MKRDNLNLLVLLVLIFNFVIISCSNTNNVKHVRDQFKEVIDDFDEQKQQVAEEFQEGKEVLLDFKEAIKKAKNKDAQFAKVHNKWEEIEKTVKELREKFIELVKTADNFFAVLEEKANSIQDPDLREKTLNELNKSKQKYIERLRITKLKINELDRVNKRVEDIITALEISYSLDILEEQINKTFKEIDMMISSVMKELDELSKESKALLNRRYGGY